MSIVNILEVASVDLTELEFSELTRFNPKEDTESHIVKLPFDATVPLADEAILALKGVEFENSIKDAVKKAASAKSNLCFYAKGKKGKNLAFIVTSSSSFVASILVELEELEKLGLVDMLDDVKIFYIPPKNKLDDYRHIDKLLLNLVLNLKSVTLIDVKEEDVASVLYALVYNYYALRPFSAFAKQKDNSTD